MKNSIIGKIQFAVSAIAVLLIAVFSLTPLIGIKLESSMEIYDRSFDTVLEIAMEKKAEEISKDEGMSVEQKQKAEEDAVKSYLDIAYGIAGVDENGEKAESCVNPSFIGLIKAFPDTVKLAKYYFKAYVIDGMGYDSVERAMELAELAEEMDADAVNAESVDMFRLFFNDIIASCDVNAMLGSEGDEAMLEFVATVLLAAIRVGVLVSLLVIFPVVMILSCIGFLFVLLSHKKYKAVLKKCKNATVKISVLVSAVLVCGGTLTACGVLMILTAGVAVAVNILASRFKSYTSNERRFLNVMQLCALASTAGAVIFAIFIAKSDTVNMYLNFKFMTQATNGMTNIEKISVTIAVFLLMSILVFAVVISLVKSALKLVTRAACMGKSGGNGFLAALFGIGLIVANHYITDNYGITLTQEQSDNLTVALVGCAVMLVSAVAFRILKKVFAGNISKKEVKAVMCGTSVQDAEDEK